MSRLACLGVLVMLAAPAATQDRTAEHDLKIKEGDAALRRMQWDDALRTYKAANALVDKKSPRALIGMARAYEGLKAHKSAAESCADAIKYTADDKVLEATARNLRGKSLFALVEKSDDKRLKEAEQEFRTVLSLTDTLPIAHYNLGIVLMKQTRDQEGLAELRTFLDKAGASPEAASAKRFIDNPRRAREPFAPDFSVTTMDGEHLALEDLAGKVVLIDFWATWCTPCVAATPGLAKLQRKFKDQPFVILGISADRDRNAWKTFILENRLQWHHVYDDRRTVQRAFNVDVYPTYMLLDHEGIVRYTRAGWNPSVDGEIESQAKKLLKNAAASK